jgi:hypothetical protein
VTSSTQVKDEPDWAQGWGNFDSGVEVKQPAQTTQEKT